MPLRLLRRQRVLVSLLDQVGGEMGERDFQELLFDYCLQCREHGVDSPYDFITDERGIQSFTSIADRNRLARRGIFTSDAWHLTAKGHQIAQDLGNRDATDFASHHRSRDHGSETDGKCRSRFNRHDQSRTAIDNSNPNGGLLATIGYEGRSYEAYLNELLRSGISCLCDVRRNPLSRKWGFSKRVLSQGCNQVGIQYKAFPELGIEARHRVGLSDRAAHDRLFAWYEAETLPRRQDAVARITAWVEEGKRVAITCYERDPEDCHRSRIARAIMAIAAQPMPLKHL